MTLERLTMVQKPRFWTRSAVVFAIVPALGIAACSHSGCAKHDEKQPVAPTRSESPDPNIATNGPATPMDPQKTPAAVGTVLRIIPDGPEADDAEIRYAWASIEWHGRNEMFWLPLNGAETTVQLQKTVPTSELLTIRFSIPDKQSEVGRFVQGEWAARHLSGNDTGGGHTVVYIPMSHFKRIDEFANRMMRW